jgi:hypothetical protein
MKRPSFCFVARQIYIRDGLVGFFRGLGPCFLRTFPVNASALFVYEEIMRALGAEKVFCNMLNRVNFHMLTALQRHAAKYISWLQFVPFSIEIQYTETY